ncbi:hypothetical protein [Ferrovibrio sp.]|uniref:hypothetical protein n=1 Tax=Ferrovibrio sp. TaxID=1917215 RepID=UPI0035162706
MRLSTFVFILLLLPVIALAQSAGPAVPTVPEPARPAVPAMPGATTESRPGAAKPAAGGLLHGLRHGMVAAPQLPGNGAFGAVQEILAILEADPKTDWGRVDLDALRAHLIDMNEVMLQAGTAAMPVAGGLRITVTGTGRTLAAVQRMVPAHAREIDGHDGWRVAAEGAKEAVILTVTAKDAGQTARIRALGFAGIMATGAHHQMHHLAIARGQPAHAGGHRHGGQP